MQQTKIDINEIQVGERYRSIDPASSDIQNLCENIRQNGLVTALTICQDSRLIAGGRRLTALRQLADKTFEPDEGLGHAPWTDEGEKEVVSLEASNVPVSIVFVSDEAHRLQLEIAENSNREDVPWQETVVGIAKLHHSRRLANIGIKKWTQRLTGELLQCSAAHINHALLVAKAIIADDKEIKEAANLTEATRLMLLRKEAEADKLAMAQTKAGHHLVETPTTTAASKRDIGRVLLTDPDDEEEEDPVLADEAPATPVAKSTSPPQIIKLAKFGKHGSCLDFIPKLPEGSVDHIVTDPPYGIDMGDMDNRQDIDRVADEHDVEENLQLLEAFLPLAFRILKDRGWLLFFYDLSHHEKLRDWASAAGFKVQPWPLTIAKTSAAANRAAHTSWTKTEEWVMVCRKGNATLREVQSTSRFACSFAAARKQYDHPFAKPYEVWEWLLNAVASPKQTILDPFAGSFSCCDACLNLGLRPFGMEVNEKHFNQGMQMLKRSLEESYPEAEIVG